MDDSTKGDRQAADTNRAIPKTLAETDVVSLDAAGAAKTNVKKRSEPVGITGGGAALKAEFGSRYNERELLGEGGMGAVTLFRDERIGRDVAMKTVHKGFQKDATVQARFSREARVQGQLEHPSVVPVYDLGERPDGSA